MFSLAIAGQFLFGLVLGLPGSLFGCRSGPRRSGSTLPRRRGC
jgi:hypothetical protein